LAGATDFRDELTAKLRELERELSHFLGERREFLTERVRETVPQERPRAYRPTDSNGEKVELPKVLAESAT
jgi:hypothetical protein